MNTPATTARACCFGYADAQERSPSLVTGIFAAADLSPAMPVLLLVDLGAWSLNAGVPLADVAATAVRHAHARLLPEDAAPLDAVSVVLMDAERKFDHWDPVFQRRQPLLAAGAAARSSEALRCALGPSASLLLAALQRHGVSLSA